jgi:ribosome recycling factor
VDPNLTEPNTRIQGAIEHLKQELSSIRAGRANPSIIENVSVEAYGAKMKLMEVGTISAPQPTLLTIQVWDAGLLNSVVKSIQEANLGFNPSNDGQTIRITLPPLTQERREEFVKLVHVKMESARVEVRQVRQDFRQVWEKEKEASSIGEDELFRREKILQELIDKSMEQIEDLGKIKESELMQV